MIGHRLRALGLAFALALMLAPLAASAAPQILRPNGAPLELDVRKGLIVRLDRPAANVFIADPSVADVEVKSPTTIYVVGKAAGETTLFAVDHEDHVLIDSRVEVRHDADALQQALNKMIPNNHVEVHSVDDSVVLSGPVFSAAQGANISRIAARFVPDQKHIINDTELDAPNQVNLRVRIAEVSRTVLKQLGVNWNALETVNGKAMAGNAIFPLSLATPVPSTFTTATNSLGLGYKSGSSGSTNIDAVIDALEEHDLLTVLAEPNLTAVSGQKASFLAGGEFPIPVPQSSNGSTPIITIEYKQFGVSLNFTPTILGHDRIGLHVEPEVSQLSTQNSVSFDGFVIPSLTTRRAATTVELGSGQSFIIGGLLQNSTTQDLTKFPWLGDVPVLGALFRSTSFQRNETELVIIVTPYIVKPDSDKRLIAPTDGFVAPTDADRVLNGTLNHRTATPLPASPTSAAPASATVAIATPHVSVMPLDKSSATAPLASARPDPAHPPIAAPVGPIGYEID